MGSPSTVPGGTFTNSQAQIGDLKGSARSKPQPWQRGADSPRDRTQHEGTESVLYSHPGTPTSICGLHPQPDVIAALRGRGR
jgi:hypothetical protein